MTAGDGAQPGALRPGRRILVVDDDATLRAGMVRYLEQAGNLVFAANSGRDGVEVLRRQPVELVITDIFMPDSDGIELIIASRRIAPWCPIIAISGGGPFWPSQVAATKQLGVRATLWKPFHFPDLLGLVREILPCDGGEIRL